MVNLKSTSHFTAMQFVLTCLVAILLFLPAAYAQEDVEFRGFIENATFVRTHLVGLNKSRTTLQLELSKAWNPGGLFSEVSLGGTFRHRRPGATAEARGKPSCRRRFSGGRRPPA